MAMSQHSPTDEQQGAQSRHSAPTNEDEGVKQANTTTVTTAAHTELADRLQAVSKRCVVIDLETTGLDPHSDQIIEIALLRVRDGNVVDRFHTRVNPNSHIPAESTAIHGLTDAHVASAPFIEDVTRAMQGFLDDEVLVGHNVAFDMGFVEEAIAEGGLSWGGRPPRTLCTAKAARELIPRSRVGRYTLENVARLAGSPVVPSHSADVDALATVDVLNWLADEATLVVNRI